MDMVNCMLLSSGTPENHWSKALLSVCFILNSAPLRTPTLHRMKVEKEEFLTSNSSTSGVVWLRFLYRNRRKRKSAPRLLMLSLSDMHLIETLTDSQSEICEISNNTIIEVRDAVYFENIFSLTSRISSGPSITPSTFYIPSSSSAPTDDFEPRRSKRTRTLTSFGEDFFTYPVEGDPSSFKKAMNSSKSSFQKEAIDSEIKSIMENNTWILTDLPPRCKGCKWIFKKKL